MIPQAVRLSIPALGNEYISNLKNTSLVSVISLVELTLIGQRIYSVHFRVLETLAAIACIYLAMVTVFSQLQRVVERRWTPTNVPQPVRWSQDRRSRR